MANMSNSSNSSNLAFCLEYSNHKSDMMDAFFQNLTDGNMVDVILSCEGNTIKAHKMILSAGSSYFREIFAAFKSPFQYPVVIIKDMPFRDLKAIVEFLYRGEVVVPVEQVSSLSKSGQSLNIKGLEKYFNNSAFVDVANTRNVNNNDAESNIVQINKTKNQMNGINNSAKRQPVIASKPRAINIEPKRNSNKSCASPINNGELRSTPGMNLRRVSRPNYRQLSNGDISDDSSNEERVQHIVMSNNKSRLIQFRRQQQTHISYNQISKPIKSEIVYEDYDDEEEQQVNGPPVLKMQINNEPNTYIQPNNGMENEDECGDEYQNKQNDEMDNNTDAVFGSEANTSRYIPGAAFNFTNIRMPQMNIANQNKPRGVIPNPLRVAPRKVKAPFVGRHPRRRNERKERKGTKKSRSTVSNNQKIGPIKQDPDKVEIVQCTICPRVFSQHSSLNLHMKRLHGDDEKEHVCQLCGKKYSWRSGLYKHMRSHNHNMTV